MTLQGEPWLDIPHLLKGECYIESWQYNSLQYNRSAKQWTNHFLSFYLWSKCSSLLINSCLWNHNHLKIGSSCSRPFFNEKKNILKVTTWNSQTLIGWVCCNVQFKSQEYHCHYDSYWVILWSHQTEYNFTVSIKCIIFSQAKYHHFCMMLAVTTTTSKDRTRKSKHACDFCQW